MIDKNGIMIRAFGTDQIDFFKEMFYTSLFVAAGEAPYPYSIIDKPGLKRYYQDWGQKSDFGLIAFVGKEPIGATWSRFFTESDPGYGFVNEESPEIGIALKSGYRGQGIGSQLLIRLMQELSQRAVPSISLSVDQRNRALKLYRDLGFRVYRQEGNAVVMFKLLDAT